MNEIVKKETGVLSGYSREQMDLIKNHYCKGATDLEFQMFVEVAKAKGLCPLSGQIHSVPRKVKNRDTGQYETVRTIQTSVDGHRAIASKTGQYAGSSAPRFTMKKNPQTGIDLNIPDSASVTVKRLLPNGVVGEFTSVVRWDEFVRPNSYGKIPRFYNDMPTHMLGKVAECQALRKAFPVELGGIYAPEEMQHVSEEVESSPGAKPVKAEVVEDKGKLIEEIAAVMAERCKDMNAEEKVAELKMALGVSRWDDLALKSAGELKDLLARIK